MDSRAGGRHMGKQGGAMRIRGLFLDCEPGSLAVMIAGILAVSFLAVSLA